MIVVTGSCLSQQPKINQTEVIKAFQKKIGKIGFNKLIFLSPELIKVCADTTYRSKFAKQLLNHHSIKRKTIDDQNEFDFTLHLLYESIGLSEVSSRKDIESKNYLLAALSRYRSSKIKIDERLVLNQIDETKRGFGHGYDEGSTSESRFLFFCHDAMFFKSVLLENKMIDDWSRIGAFICNYLRENETPKPLRYLLKERIINKLKNSDMREVIEELKGCDVSINLYD
jgi:hypothetical protein